MDIYSMVENAKLQGYNEANAQSKVCQDIILSLISQSSLSRNVTIKGGVVMRSISNNSRRATQDIDFDFIKYSLADDSILAFIDKLNAVGIVEVKSTGVIEELKQQDYHGKRVHISITDENGYNLTSKVDIGVHKNFDIEQEEYCFDLGIDDESASLLINSKEQMLVEKLRSILIFGPFSTRYKDIYDIYYLSSLVDKGKLLNSLNILVFNDTTIRENSINDILNRLSMVFKNKQYLKNLSTSKKNWLNIDNDVALNGIIDFLESIR